MLRAPKRLPIPPHSPNPVAEPVAPARSAGCSRTGAASSASGSQTPRARNDSFRYGRNNSHD